MRRINVISDRFMHINAGCGSKGFSEYTRGYRDFIDKYVLCGKILKICHVYNSCYYCSRHVFIAVNVLITDGLIRNDKNC